MAPDVGHASIRTTLRYTECILPPDARSPLDDMRIIGELKSAMQFDYIPCRKRLANETYMLAAVFAHNLLRRLQMQQAPVRSNREWSRPACWIFEKAEHFRLTVLQRAGRMTAPKNRPTLTSSGDHKTEDRFTSLLKQLRPAA